ncbi:MAG TPA: HAMP domain-containing sensor histidine kinase [Candidatus Binatia bacterium]|nr:HAMP domain-containing sensor histidine kinase [Candidatus Binatia bacterium]
MTESGRSTMRGLVIAAGAGVTLASALAWRSEDWPIYVVFVLLSFLVHLPAVEVLPHVPLPVAELVTNIAFLYIGGPPIIVLRFIPPVVFASIPGRMRLRWRMRLFGCPNGTADDSAAKVAADWSAWTLGLGARWSVVWALLPHGNAVGHPGVMLLGEVVGYAVSGLLVLLPIYSFRPFLREARQDTPLHMVVEDMGLIVVLTVTPFVFLVVYGYRTHGLLGASAWSLAALGLHFVLQRLNDRRLRVEEQNRHLEDLQRELAHRERLSAIGKMSSVVSHQILQQLGVIGLYADLIGNACEDGAPAERLERARDNARAIEQALASVNGVLRDLLVFSKDQRVNSYEHALGTVVEEAVESCRPAAAERAVALRADVPADLRLSLDKLKIRQALANLLRNAIEASPSGAEVDVHAVAHDGWVEVAVTDHGPGVSPAERDAVFAPFFTTKEQGTGLGLAIAREFVRAHGGDIRVADTAAPGATFVVRLPRGGTASPSDSGHAP